MSKFGLFLQSFFLTLIFIASSVSAGVFKWVDENGNTHFGDRPQSKSVEKINIDKNTGPDKFTAERLNRQNQYLEDRQLEREEKSYQKNEATKKKHKNQKKCEKINKKLTLLEKQVRLYRKQANGEKLFLSDKERVKEKSKLKRYKKEVCS